MTNGSHTTTSMKSTAALDIQYTIASQLHVSLSLTVSEWVTLVEVILAQQQYHEFYCCSGLSHSTMFLFDTIDSHTSSSSSMSSTAALYHRQSTPCFSLRLVAVTLAVAQQQHHKFCCCTVLSQSTVLLSDTNDSHTNSSMRPTDAVVIQYTIASQLNVSLWH